MGKNKNRHFDRKNAQRFRLVPGGPDPFEGICAASSGPPEPLSEEARKAEQLTHGIYYDDNYNYLQHLKSSSDPPRLELIRYKIGAVNNGPVDPIHQIGGELQHELLDAPEAVNEDGVSEVSEVDHQLELEDVKMDGNDELEDDFIVKANCGTLPSLEEHGLVAKSRVFSYPDPTGSKGRMQIEEDEFVEESSSECSMEDDMDRYFEEKGKVGAAPSNNEQQRSIIDERLAKMLESYDDGDIGALDDEDIRGGSLQPNDDLFKQAEEDFEKRKIKKKASTNIKELPVKPVALATQDTNLEGDEEVSSLDEEESDSEEIEKIRVTVKPKESRMYNCESILSITSSCVPSHLPRIISEKNDKQRNASISSNTKPKSFKPVKECSESNSVETCSDNNTNNKLPIVRKRDETAEERKARKAELRERKKDRREQKKALKDVFGREKCEVERQLAATLSAVRLA